MFALGLPNGAEISTLEAGLAPQTGTAEPAFGSVLQGRRAPFTVAPVPQPSREDDSSSPTRVLSLAWWVRDKYGSVTLAQWPNPALAVWLVTVVVGWTGVLGPARSTTLADVGRGASPFRRLLGAVVLAGQLVSLLA